MTWLIHTCDMTNSYVWHNSCIHMTWVMYTCDMTHANVWHDSFIRVTCLIHMCDMTHPYVSWLMHMCYMTHLYVWHDSFKCMEQLISCHVFICVTWLISCHVFTCVTWLIQMLASPTNLTRFIHMCKITHSYVWHDSFWCMTDFTCVSWLVSFERTKEQLCVPFSFKNHARATWLIDFCETTHLYVWHHKLLQQTNVYSTCSRTILHQKWDLLDDWMCLSVIIYVCDVRLYLCIYTYAYIYICVYIYIYIYIYLYIYI